MAVPILLYHQVAPPPSRSVPFRSMFVHPKSFERQMALLNSLGFTGLSLRDAMPYIRGEKHGRVAAVTFDDGAENNLEIASPILKKYGFTATNYIVSNYIGASNSWDRHLGISETPCMDESRIRRWLADGHEIGSHTQDHVALNHVSEEDARRQIAESRVQLADMFGVNISSVAFPYGEHSQIHRDFAREAGYSWAVTIEKRNAKAIDDPYGLPRRTIRRDDTLLHFLRKIYF